MNSKYGVVLVKIVFILYIKHLTPVIFNHMPHRKMFLNYRTWQHPAVKCNYLKSGHKEYKNTSLSFNVDVFDDYL